MSNLKLESILNRWEEIQEDEVEIENGDGQTELKFIAETDDDLRPLVGAYLMQKNCGLLSFTEEGMDLEEIFKRSTRR